MILLVAVLISDHLSRARRTRVDEVQPSEVLLAEGSLAPTDPLAPMDPLRGTIESHNAQPAPGSSNPAPAPAPALGANPAFTSPIGGPLAGPIPSSDPTRGAAPASLRDQVAAAGGTIVPGSVPTIILPSTTSLGTPATQPGTSGSDAAPVTPLPNIEESTRYHAVQKGDTLYRLAERYYGSGNRWRVLAEANRDRIGTNGLLHEGVRLRIPPGEPAKAARGATPAKQSQPKAAGPTEVRIASSAKARAKTYTVRSGDTLGAIALKTLGTSRRWREILDLNHLDEEEILSPGVVLKLP